MTVSEIVFLSEVSHPTMAFLSLAASQVPHILDSLSSLYQSMDARVTMLGKLCQLQGKLDLLLAQVGVKKNLHDILYSQ